MNTVRDFVRAIMRRVATMLNTISGGKITPNAITLLGLAAHFPIAWLILMGADNAGYLVIAGILLVIFGLFDTLDGELARLQKRASAAGMFLDSVTDRMKEILIYLGIVGYFSILSTDIQHEFEAMGMIATVSVVATMGGSILVSYLNAWGEAVLARNSASKSTMNKTFRGGAASFEIRMALLALGLILHSILLFVIWIIGILVVTTILQRLARIFRELNRVQD